MSTRDLTTDNAEPVITHGYAQDGRLRIEQSGKSHFVTIQTKQAEIDIDPSTRSYQVRDQEELMRIGAQESTNHDKNVARSAAFPADTPANLRVMPDQMNASADENLAIQKQPPDYRATYRHETVDGYVCSIWEYYWKGSKQAEYCIAPPALIPGGTEWMAALRAEGDFYESASQWLGDPGRLILAPTRPQAEAPSRLDGILLMIRSFNQGKAASESRVITERVEQLKPELFDVPKDYQRK
ncbi:MAG: hypothetical protein ABSF96_16070 [Steroidobacteraceae bacterium]